MSEPEDAIEVDVPAAASASAAGWRRLLRDVGSLVAGNAIGIGLNLVTLVLLARLLGPDAFGVLATVLAIASLGAILADFGLNQVTIREAVRQGAAAADIYQGSFSTKLSLILLAAPIALAASPSALLASRPVLFVVPIAVIALSSLNTTLQTLCNVRGAFGRLARLRLLETTLPPAGGVLAALLRPTAEGAAAGYLVAWVVVLAATQLSTRGFLARMPRFRLGFSKALLRPASWFGLLALITFASSRLTLVVAARVTDVHALGDYAASQRLAEPLMVLVASLATTLYPDVVRRSIRRQARGMPLVWASGALGAAGVVLWFVASLVAPVLVPLVLGPAFVATVPLFRIQALAFPLGLMSLPTSLVADATDHQRLHVLNGIYMVPLAIGLAYVWGIRWGAVGVCWAVVVARLSGVLIGAPVMLAFLTRGRAILWPHSSKDA